jgi:hypothetical protein
MAQFQRLLGRLLRRVSIFVRVGSGVGIEGCCQGSEYIICHFEVAHSGIEIVDFEFDLDS